MFWNCGMEMVIASSKSMIAEKAARNVRIIVVLAPKLSQYIRKLDVSISQYALRSIPPY